MAENPTWHLEDEKYVLPESDPEEIELDVQRVHEPNHLKVRDVWQRQVFGRDPDHAVSFYFLKMLQRR
ncbi:hypothetical protein, partial [Mycobacterium tuberculosis]|uniref:hypothetical protein n=1 Tax=Mycobacterium tuberculosis TaxID=1773 RepID=UPI001BDCD16D